MSSPLPILPIELVRDIIEIAADNDFATAMELDILNRTVRQWVGPIIFRRVILHDASSLIQFAELLRQAPSYSSDPTQSHCIVRDRKFYAEAVKFISMMHVRTPFHLVEHIFSVCSGITTLELDNFYVELSLPHVQATMRPQRLIWPTLFVTTHMCPTFSNVTHVWFSSRQEVFHNWPPSLKCLAFPIRPIDLAEDPRQDWLINILNIPLLTLLVLNVLPRYQYLSASLDDTTPMQSPELWDRYLKQFRDERIVIRSINTVSEDLEVCRQTGESLWTRAQRLGTRHSDFSKV